jgi:hypothetical protein
MLNPNELSALSCLLDEALELEPVQLEPWLAALPSEHQGLAQAPWIARQSAVIGLCASGAGDKKMALAYAAQARAALTAQPSVSPYGKAPLVKLERALGPRLPPV